jgi:hypothetical protein
MAAAFSTSTEFIAPPNDDAMREPASAPASSHVLPDAASIVLAGSHLLTYEAMHLLILLDRDLREARAQWNQDWFRRLMRIRPKAVSRLKRRWAKIDPSPAIPLGPLTRRYHANLSRYRYHLPDA